MSQHTHRNPSISALSFVHSDGTSQSKVVNRKLIRTHITRRFHSERSERLRQKPRIVRKQVLRWIAPQPKPLTEQDLFLVEKRPASNISEEELQAEYQRSPTTTTVAMLPHAECSSTSFVDVPDPTTDSVSQTWYSNNVESETDDVDEEIECFVDLPKHDDDDDDDDDEVSAGEAGSSSTLVRYTHQGAIGFHEGVPILRNQSRSYALLYPQIVHFLPSRSLGTPVMVSASPQARSLVEQFASRVDDCAKVRGLLPSTLPLRNAYMPAARFHTALWYASVFFASATNQVYQRVPVNSVSLKFKGETIRAINSYLNDPSSQTTDEMIAAVLCLASIDSVIGNFDEFRTHLRAVGDMVRLRGGLDSLGFNFLLARLIEMCEWRWALVAHNSTGSIIPCSSRTQPQQMIPPNLFTLDSPVVEFPASPRPVSALLIQLQNLAMSWDLQTPLSYSSARTMFDASCKVFYERLIAFGPPAKIKQIWTVADYEYESFRLACLLYSANGAETEQIRLKNRKMRVQELYQHLRLTEISKYWTDIPGALLWCLAVGVTESWDCPEYSWFMVNLVPVLMTLSMECWSELQRSLNTLGWLVKCGRKCMIIPRT